MNNINYINMNQMNPFSFSYQNNTSTKLMGSARLKKEYEFCSQDEDLIQIGCNFGLNDNNLFIWKVSMVGERNTPYEVVCSLLKYFFQRIIQKMDLNLDL